MKQCITCGNDIHFHRSKYCCNECNPHISKHITYNKVCEFCGEKFTTNKPTQVVCSTKCRYKLSSKQAWQKIKADPTLRAEHSMKRLMLFSLNGQKNGRHWETLVGYTKEQLKEHLELQFTNGMSWDNYGKGGWEIDHIIPRGIFNFKSIKSKGFQKCWSLENLRPMWGKDNAAKSNKLFV